MADKSIFKLTYIFAFVSFVACTESSLKIEPIRTFKSGKSFGVTSLKFAPSGKTVYGAAYRGWVFSWDAQSAELTNSFRAHDKTITSIELTPDGKHLITGGFDGLLKVWDTHTLTLISQVTAHPSPIEAVDLDSTGKILISAEGLGDREVKFWSIPDLTHTGTFKVSRGNINAARFEPSKSEYFAVSTSNGVSIVARTKDYSELFRFRVAEQNGVQRLDFAGPDTLIVGSVAGLKAVNYQSGEKLATYTFPTHSLTSVLKADPESNTVFAGNLTGALFIWDYRTNKATVINRHSVGVDTLEVSPDGSHLAHSGEPGHVIFAKIFRPMNAPK